MQSLIKGYSVEDAKAITKVDSGIQFLDGHFAVPLPWKGGPKTVLSNYASALTRLHQLQRKLTRGENTQKVRTIHGKDD